MDSVIMLWKSVMFSDETKIAIKHADGRLQVYRKKNERYKDRLTMANDNFKGSGSVILWGALLFTAELRFITLKKELLTLPVKEPNV